MKPESRGTVFASAPRFMLRRRKTQTPNPNPALRNAFLYLSGEASERGTHMSKDLSVLLHGWDYNSNEVTVRRVLGIDGREKIQMRLDLGVLKMELDGRPDGRRPHGYESLLEYHLDRREQFVPKDGEDWGLNENECGEIKQEAMQYYYRYLSMFHLGDYWSVLRDTERNMRVFDLIRDNAIEEHDRMSLEQFRPYVLMMSARARACIALEEKHYDRALDLIEDGIEDIKIFFQSVDREDLVDQCREIQFLEEWSDRIRNNRPLTPAERLKRELSQAVEKEDYERAAQLRDQIRELV